MKKLIAVVLLSAGVFACGGKKPDATTPKPVEPSATGSAAYGGAAYGAQPVKAANPCASTGH